MELALSLGEASKPFNFLDHQKTSKPATTKPSLPRDVGFCMAITPPKTNSSGEKEERLMSNIDTVRTQHEGDHPNQETVRRSPPQPSPVQLNLFPSSPVHVRTIMAQHPSPPICFPWLTDHLTTTVVKDTEAQASRDQRRLVVSTTRNSVDQVDVAEEEGAAANSSSPNSAASSFQMEYGVRSGSSGGGGSGGRRDSVEGVERGLVVSLAKGSNGNVSDDEENGLARKKLRLSKDQSAFLEESFKVHSTLNPKQKLALAKQLNLRPRQVEVWFQNRRARTKLKQTEVDCEYLKRCCETLTEENRRLRKELQELRALKTTQPFYMQLPATTLTMCPSCERVATTSTPSVVSAASSPGCTAPVLATDAATSTTLSLSNAQVQKAQALLVHHEY